MMARLFFEADEQNRGRENSGASVSGDALPNEAVAADGQAKAGLSGEEANSSEARRFFRRRTLFIVLLVVGFVAINAATGMYVDFDFVSAAVDVPGAIAWMAVNFLPSVESLQKLDQILPALASTVLDSVAASTTAAVFAYFTAVLGSASVGIGRAAQLLARGVASLFRNIPVVAWAFILLFSFHQSEFTGYLALFFGSYGYLTRCFMESIDEVSGGAVEALRATGATYTQVIAQAVIPLSLTAVVSWTLYMVETNIRDATLVGILTGTGIGFVFNLFYKSFRYDTAGLVILLIVVVVIACELLSNYVRRRMI